MAARRAGARCLELPVPSSVGEEEGRRSAARNAGTDAGHAEVILYVDADMMLRSGYLEEIRLYHAADGDLMIRGQRAAITRVEQAKGAAHCMEIAASRRPREDKGLPYQTGHRPLPRDPMTLVAALALGTLRSVALTRREFGLLAGATLNHAMERGAAAGEPDRSVSLAPLGLLREQ